ncbi:MAG TPA: ABC transporter permease [Propionibacteriaceae bacterium]|nr:ABC transporter permease [Propionibacteriaceae bacterium]HPZ49443.1 ABC transporter permease [Propionibacteriaceae bacterium]
MIRAILLRLLLFAASLLGASGIIFLVVNALPGDVAQVILGTGATPEAVAALRQRYGLDRPGIVRYLSWLGGLFTGNLGTSYVTGESVTSQVLPRLGVTTWLVSFAVIVALVVAIPQGMVAAMQRRRWQGALASATSQIGLAIPAFYAGILLVVVFAVKLRWLPANGYQQLHDDNGWHVAAWAQRLILPVASLAIVQASVLTRYVRSAFVEVLNEDWFRTARSVGWTRWRALWRHGIRNAAISVVTVLGLQLATMLVGAIVVEQVFSLPGLGTLLLTAVGNRDLQLVQGIVLLLVAAVLVINLLVDLSYLAIDPRLRSARGGSR